MRRGLSEKGFIEGRNVAIEYRWADGQLDRMRAMAADLISRKVAVILAGGSNTGVREVIAATQTIPIVFTSAVDPVATGIVVSLARPGGNATGVTFFGSELVAKQLELLQELIPSATKIAALTNPSNPLMERGSYRTRRRRDVASVWKLLLSMPLLSPRSTRPSQRPSNNGLPPSLLTMRTSQVGANSLLR